MNRRIRKKKGLLKDPYYNELKKEMFKEMEEKVSKLEQQSGKSTEIKDG